MNTRGTKRSVRVALFVLLCGLAPVCWSLYQGMKVHGIDRLQDENARALLSRNGFVVVPVFYKQMFQIYLESRLPTYVTTDSAFRAYHVILEDAIRDLEGVNASLIFVFSKKAAEASVKALHDAKSAEGKRAARLLAAWFSLAAKIADERYEPDPLVLDAVTAEWKKIEAGAMDRSAIFGNDHEYKFQYDTFKPRGIYAGNPRMEKYFRIMVLYGCFGFRIVSAEETLAVVFLLRLLDTNPDLRETHARIEGCYRCFVGEPDDLTVEEYESVYRSVFGDAPNEDALVARLDAFRQALKPLRTPRTNDQLLWPDEWLRFRKETKGLRLFGVKRVPDNELFQPLVDNEENPLPSGLYVAAALGSPSAKRALRKTKTAEFMTKLDDAAAAFRGQIGESNYAKTLKCLQLLFADPPENAPRFMRSQVWQDREAFGFLASWASIRHTWALHAKVYASYMGLYEPEPGYVEARPEFFRALAALARETAGKLDEFTKGVGREPERLKQILQRECLVGEQVGWGSNVRDLSKEKAEQLVHHSRTLQGLYRKALEGAALTNEEQARLDEALDSYAGRPMRDLIKVLDMLASIAEKQLARKELSEEEKGLLNTYGETLAALAFYFGNSYLDPRDDMPIIVDVCSNPWPGIDKVLEVGIGKAMPIYVIMKDRGKQYLCEGAVMSYYEFGQPMNERLNDEEWRSMVGNGQAALPEWTSTFASVLEEGKILRALRRGRILPELASVPRAKVLSVLRDVLQKPQEDRLQFHELAREYVRRAEPEDVPMLLELLAQPKPPITLFDVMTGNERVAAILIPKGVGVEAVAKQFDMALREAAQWGHRHITELLIDHGASVEVRDRSGNTVLNCVASRPYEHPDIAEFLIKKGADVNARGELGRTPLIHAALVGHPEIAALLVRHGADVSARDDWGLTALSGAADGGHAEIADLLIRAGADVNAKDKKGATPLDRAEDEAMRLLLRKHGGKSGQEIK